MELGLNVKKEDSISWEQTAEHLEERTVTRSTWRRKCGAGEGDGWVDPRTVERGSQPVHYSGPCTGWVRPMPMRTSAKQTNKTSSQIKKMRHSHTEPPATLSR